MKKIFSFLMLAICTITLFSCSKESPKAVAEKFTNAVNHRDFGTAMTLATEDSKKQLEMLAQLSREMPATSEEEAKKIKVKMGEEKIDGNRAVVFYTTSESKLEQRVNLVKVNDKWLVEWNKSDTRPIDETPAPTVAPINIDLNSTDTSTQMNDSMPAATLTVD